MGCPKTNRNFYAISSTTPTSNRKMSLTSVQVHLPKIPNVGPKITVKLPGVGIGIGKTRRKIDPAIKKMTAVKIGNRNNCTVKTTFNPTSKVGSNDCSQFCQSNWVYCVYVTNFDCTKIFLGSWHFWCIYEKFWYPYYTFGDWRNFLRNFGWIGPHFDYFAGCLDHLQDLDFEKASR